MKIKKLLALILNIALVFSLAFSNTQKVNAEESQAGLSLEFALTAENGETALSVNHNEVITISFVMTRTDLNESYSVNAFQNYIHYDLNFFELVEGSIVCYDTGSAVAKRQDNITWGEIVQCQNMGQTYEANFVFCTFKLKIIGTDGTGIVYNDRVQAFTADYQSIPVTTRNLTASICKHVNITTVSAKEANCYEDGWNAYSYCGDCDLLFDENAQHIIDRIPVIKGGHEKAEHYSHDNTGHWYDCSSCDDKVDYADHTGSVANCISKAHCDVCGIDYGEIDSNNHVNTYVENYQFAWFFGDGYSGDVHCSDCGEMVKQGEVLSKFDTSAWPWWVLLISIPLFPLILIVWVFFY